MNEEIKARWVEALRSGKYAQCIGVLKEGDSLGTRSAYCCLGVLAELNNDLEMREDNDGLLNWRSSARQYSMEFIPVEILAMKIQKKLADLNDTGYDFEYIAKEIEENVK